MFKLPDLKNPYSSYEPYIDSQTMEIHHSKHHAMYVTNLNKALETHPELQDKKIEELLLNLNSLPDEIRTVVRNNGGGHWNHSFFWELLNPSSTKEPVETLKTAIEKKWGSFDSFKEAFSKAALGRFGSGWAWLIQNGNELEIVSTPNQDNPLMENKKAILGLDVWEHAYYLKYQNKRADYISAFWNLVDWEFCEKLFTSNS